MKQERSKKCAARGCQGTHPLICKQEGCAILSGEVFRQKKDVAYTCTCGSVNFHLIADRTIVCAGCDYVLKKRWSNANN